MANDKPAGGSGDDSISLDDFKTDYNDLEEGQTLWDTVDILGMAQTFSKSVLVAVISVFIGAIMAIRDAVGEVHSAIVGYLKGVWSSVFGAPGDVQARLSEMAGESIADAFGLAALPVSVAVSLSVFVVAAIILYVFLGWGGD